MKRLLTDEDKKQKHRQKSVDAKKQMLSEALEPKLCEAISHSSLSRY